MEQSDVLVLLSLEPITVMLLSGQLGPVGTCTTKRFCRKSGLQL